MTEINFEAVRKQHNLVEVASRYIEMTKQGNDYVATCCFHDDKKPSLKFFSGRDGMWRFNCFACGAAGDVIDFVSEINTVSIPDAVGILQGSSFPEGSKPIARPTIQPDESKCWEPIIPVPDDAPEYNPADTYNCRAGVSRKYRPERVDPYYDGHGHLICYVVRLVIGADKITPTITYCEGPGGERRWCVKRMKAPYPLMGLDELTARPTASVLLVSGEKCREAAKSMLPLSVVITTMGGDGAVLQNDLKPILNRKIVLWPDADISGKDAMAEIGKHLKPENVRHIDTTDLPEKYDVADLIATGISQTDLYAWLKSRVRDGNIKYRQSPEAKAVAKENRAAIKEKPPVKPAATIPAPPSNVVPLQKQDEDLGIPPEYSEDSLAEAFSKKYQNTMVYVSAWKSWLLWKDNKWQNDETGIALYKARKVCKIAATEAQKRRDLGAKSAKIASMISTRKMFGNVAGIAQTDPRHVAIPTQFDADPWIINTPEGIVNLKTGRLREAKRNDFASKSTSAGPSGECPNWLRFMDTATKGDVEMQAYMQRVAGYCLTGSIAEHVFFFVYGTGGNGKGVFMNHIHWMLNNYSRNANMDTFTEQRFAKHASEIAYFQGARLVIASETEEGKRWNESRVKSMTGGDPITANHMHSNPFTFLPTFKLLFAGNHKPALRNIDDAIKRRMHLIPFTAEIAPKDRDPALPEKLRNEAGGIMAWAIKGCLDWQKTGLNPPERVLATTMEYFTEQDTMGAFISERCELGQHLFAPTTVLYQAYVSWARSNGEYALPRRRFQDQLAFRDLFSEKRGGDMAVQGIGVQHVPATQGDWTND